MEIDHVHFYVEDARDSRDWFVHHLSFQPVSGRNSSHTRIEVVRSGSIYFVFSSPLTSSSPVAVFLATHPPGVVDLALRVENLAAVLKRAVSQGVEVLQPLQHQQAQGSCRWSQISAWGTLRHTLVERRGMTSLIPDCPELDVKILAAPSVGDKAIAPDRLHSLEPSDPSLAEPAIGIPFTGIDHVVLNVARGELEQAVRWYTQVLGFQSQQMFEIKTDHSGLCSQVMVHPMGRIQLPINEPTSASSQIQEFLDINRGAGVQHIALHTNNIVAAIAHLRSAGLSLLQVPPTYYTQLKQRQHPLPEADWQAIEAQQILVDWQQDTAQAMLLQTFTQPIFKQPTFFFELIERQPYLNAGQRKLAEGFGERNFRALFEAIEQEQMKRGRL